VARQTVSDNLKAGITRACFHEPMVNRTYADLARHYGTAILHGGAQRSERRRYIETDDKSAALEKVAARPH
jgi:hypothetical protein